MNCNTEISSVSQVHLLQEDDKFTGLLIRLHGQCKDSSHINLELLVKKHNNQLEIVQSSTVKDRLLEFEVTFDLTDV